MKYEARKLLISHPIRAFLWPNCEYVLIQIVYHLVDFRTLFNRQHGSLAFNPTPSGLDRLEKRQPRVARTQCDN